MVHYLVRPAQSQLCIYSCPPHAADGGSGISDQSLLTTDCVTHDARYAQCPPNQLCITGNNRRAHHSPLEQRMECSGPVAVTLLIKNYVRYVLRLAGEIWRIDSSVEHELVGWCTCHSPELWSLLLSSSFLSRSRPVAWSQGTTDETQCHHSLLHSQLTVCRL